MKSISHVIKQKTVQEVLNEVDKGIINPDPIGQRPAVQSGWKKSQGIIDSILRNFSVGTITVRDIEHDLKNQEVYGKEVNSKKVNWLVIDGGNRVRAIRDFMNDRFATLKCQDLPQISSKKYTDLPEEYKLLLEKTMLQFTVYTCNDSEATQIFRRLNTVTPVNQIEMTMANDTSTPAKIMRSTVKSYKEYGYNQINPLFELTTKSDGSTKALHWATDVNPRRKWDEYVGIALLKSIDGGNFDASLVRIHKMVEEDWDISNSKQAIANRFFRDVKLIMDEMGSKKKLNSDIFAALQCVWFGLLEDDKNFRIKDYKKFAERFFIIHRELTGTNKSSKGEDLDVKTAEFKTGSRENPGTKTEIIRKFARSAIKNFANPAEQVEVSKLYLERMEISGAITKKTIVDKKRIYDNDDRLALYIKQLEEDGISRCPITRKVIPLKEVLDSSKWQADHIIEWSLGGETTVENGQLICVEAHKQKTKEFVQRTR